MDYRRFNELTERLAFREALLVRAQRWLDEPEMDSDWNQEVGALHDLFSAI